MGKELKLMVFFDLWIVLIQQPCEIPTYFSCRQPLSNKLKE